jgi:RecA-family ATPase
MLMSPWLRQGQLSIIYGNYGTGKSLLTLSIAYLLGLRTFDKEEHEIDTWQVKNNTGCLYIDGELGEYEMEDRVKQFEWLGVQRPECRLKILSLPEYQLATEDSFYLVKRENQLKIIQWLKEHPTYKLVVLDSISTLFGLEDENSNSEWNAKVSPFLRDLRALDVAQLLLHHSGKDGKKGLRGASAQGAMAHNIFRLTNHGDKKVDEGEAHFTITKDKFRARGFSFKSFALHYIPDERERKTTWEVTPVTSTRK